MNRVITILISSFFVLTCIWVPLISAGAPFAPLYEFTEEDFNKKYGKMGMPMKEAETIGMWPPVKENDVPDKDKIIPPAYPGAIIIEINKPSMRDNQGKLMGLSTMELLTSDPYEKVSSFYKKNLPGWNEKKYQSSLYLAQSGEVDNNPRMMKVPHVGLMNLEGGILGKGKYTGMMPDAKTVIQIFFQR